MCTWAQSISTVTPNHSGWSADQTTDNRFNQKWEFQIQNEIEFSEVYQQHLAIRSHNETVYTFVLSSKTNEWQRWLVWVSERVDRVF